MANVGGDPSTMTGGAATLHRDGSQLEQMRSAISSAGSSAAGAVGDGTLSSAVSRFAAGWSTMVGDTGVQLTTAAQLAANAAADLATAGGEHH